MTRACGLRRAPLLSLAAAVALIVSAALALTPRPAEAQTVVWSAQLTAQNIINLFTGCQEGETQDCSAALTDNTFTFDGVDYEVIRLFYKNSDHSVQLSLDKTFKVSGDLDNLSLIVGDESFTLLSATSGGRLDDGDAADWSTSNLNFAPGDKVSVSLVVTRVVAPAASPLPPKPEVKGSSYWSATLTVGKLSDVWSGCAGDCSEALTDSDFSWGANSFRVTHLYLLTNPNDDLLFFTLDKRIPDAVINDLSLVINGVTLERGGRSSRNAFYDQVQWRAPGVTLTPGSTVQVKLIANRDFPSLEQHSLPQHVPTRPASQRRPEGQPASHGFCYAGAGNGTTTIIRYPDGRVGEVPTPHSSTMKMFACN